jgi:hypothetical protein
MDTRIPKMVIGALVGAIAFAPTTDGWAQSCPPELAQAKAALEKAPATAMTEQQMPRVLAGARGQEIQSPRGQEIQSPRGQEIQSPRGQEIQSPRGQEIQSPRGQETQAPAGSKAERAAALVKESEAACQQGKMALSAEKAKAAMEVLR